MRATMSLMTTTARHARIGIAACGALLTAASLAGCSLWLDQPRGDDAGTGTGSGGNDSVYLMEVGDCLLEPDDNTSISNVVLVPCGEPHTYEFYFESVLPAGDYPSDFTPVVGPICRDGFEPYVGVPISESSLSITWFLPTREGWEQFDDRVVQCLVYDMNGDLSQSVRDSKR